MINVKFIKPSHEFNIIPSPYDGNGIIKFIEYIGRVCYKSEEKIDNDSAKKFVKMIFDRGHTSVFEHYIFNFEVPEGIFNTLAIPQKYDDDYRELLRYLKFSRYPKTYNGHNKHYISGSLRAFNQLANYIYNSEFGGPKGAFTKIYQPIRDLLPDDITYTPDELSLFLYVPDNEIKLLSRSDINRLPNEIREKHNWFSLHFITDRSVTHELVRHRLCAFSQESTRYVNYKNKGYISILPYWMNDEIKELILDNNNDTEIWKLQDSNNVIAAKGWIVDIKDSFSKYEWFMKLKDPSFTPQELKGILHESIKAEIHMTAFEDEWKHIFDLRCTNGAYPGMRELMIPVLQDISNISVNDYQDDDMYYNNLLLNIINDGGGNYIETNRTTVPIYYASASTSGD